MTFEQRPEGREEASNVNMGEVHSSQREQHMQRLESGTCLACAGESNGASAGGVQ
jgi:hypothetical protein